MTQPMGMADFFALEAGDYLERLDALLQATGAPAVDEFVRLARALRGSALMASQGSIARAAGGLETLARGVREGRLAWDPATRGLATRAIDDLKVFVRRARAWTDADGAKADALAAQLEQSGGRPSAQVRAAEALGLDAGARAFVAREGAAIASALDRAAQALRVTPRAQEPLQAVLRALQPLRGLAALADLPPLPDLLDGVERAIGELARATEPVSDAGDLFAAGARAIAQSAREVAERGRPDPDGPEFRRFAERLVRLLDADAAVVPIESLFHGDEGPHVVRRGTPAARPAALGRLELVTHGEHLRQAADSLERAPSATQRDLRAHTLAGTFRALANVGAGPLADAVARFANAARDAVTSGAATRDTATFAGQLRRAGELLAGANAGEEPALAAALDQITGGIGAAAAPAPAPAAPRARVSGTSAAVAVPPPIEDDTPAESDDLIGTWVTYRRLIAAGVGPASLDEFLKGGTAVAAAPAPARSSGPSFVAEPEPVPIASLTADPVFAIEPDVVDIRALLFRGERAATRARELRAEARAATSPERLQEILDELGDLVALAAEPVA
jgi:hypothetical protein